MMKDQAYATSQHFWNGPGIDQTKMVLQKSRVDETDLRFVLGHFATGINVVTGRDEERRPYAITVNAFTSLSLDPPLVLYCLDRSAFHFDVFSNAKAFAVNLLSEDQQVLSDRFARMADDDFPDLPVTELATGSPVLVGCLAALDCQTYAIHEGGDHLIVVGHVRALKKPHEAQPLIYFRGRYRRLEGPS